MKKIFASIAAQVNAGQITLGVILFLAVASLAIYHASSSREYGETIDPLSTMRGARVPDAGDLSTNTAVAVGLNAPTGAVVTPGEELFVPTAGEEPSGPLSNADDSAQIASNLRESGAAAQLATQASEAGGYSGARNSQAGFGSVGGAGAFSGGGSASSGGAVGGGGAFGGGSGGAVGAANHPLASSGTASGRDASAASPSSGSSNALSDARNAPVASGADSNPSSVPTIQDPITGPSAQEGSGNSTPPNNGNTSADDFGFANTFTDGGTGTNLAGTTLPDQALGLPTDKTQDGLTGPTLAQGATVPDAGNTLLLLSYGIAALLAYIGRGSFRFSGPSARM